MHELINAIKTAVQQRNWHAALFISLALPDICSSLEDPQRGVGDRYRDWFKRYLGTTYDNPPSWANTPVRFTADDSYYFRCSLLHQGQAEDDKQRTTFERIHFIEPPGNDNLVHMNMIDDALQLQVDRFCLDYCAAAERWLKDVEGRSDIQSRMARLVKIYSLNSLPKNWPVHRSTVPPN